MNTLVQFYRQQFPSDTKSDEEIMGLYASSYPAEKLAAYPDFVSDWQKIQQQQAVQDSSVTTELGRGFQRGVKGLESSAAGAMAIAADYMDREGAKNYWLDIYKRKLKEVEEEAPPSVPTIQQAGQSLSAAGQYVAGKVGELVPNVGEALITAGAGTLVAPGPGTEAGAIGGLFARGAARAAIRRAVEKGLTSEVRQELEDFAAGNLVASKLSKDAAARITAASKLMAGTTASAANFAALGAGGAYGELSQREGVTREDARTGALIAGAGASVGALIPAHILKGIFGESVGETAAKSYVDLYAKKVPGELLTAGGGMGAMEFFNILGEKYADPKKRDEDFTKEDYSRILNAVATGFIAGAPAAAISAVRGVKPEGVEKPGTAATTKREEAPPPPALPEASPPGMAAKEVTSVYPVELPKESELLFRQMAEKDLKGTLSQAERDYLATQPAVLKARYETIKSEVSNATKTGQGQESRVGEHPRVNDELRQAASDREREGDVAQKGPQDGDSNRLAQAARELDPAKKEALKAAGLDPDALSAGLREPVPREPMPSPVDEAIARARTKAAWDRRETPDWIKEALKEREAQGWNPKWPFVPADLLNKTFREGIILDPTLSLEEKRTIMKFAGPEGREELDAYEKAEKAKATARAIASEEPSGSPLYKNRGISAHPLFAVHTQREFLGLYKRKVDAERAASQFGGSTIVTEVRSRADVPEEYHGTEIPAQVERWIGEGWSGSRTSQTASRGGVITTRKEVTSTEKETQKEGDEGVLKPTQPEVQPAAAAEQPAAGIEFGAVSFAPEEPVPLLHATKLEQKNPLQLRAAIRKPSGEVIAGKPGELHMNLPVAEGDDLGFVLPDGKYLTRDQAAIWQFSPWLSNVPDAISAWRTPRAGKEETDLYSDLGRDPKNKNRTKTLGVFKTKGENPIIVVASLYDNNGRKVFRGVKGHSFAKTVDRFLDPIGYIKTVEPQEKFYREYTPEQWADVQRQLEAKRDAAKAEVAPEPAPVTAAQAAAEGLSTKPEAVEPKPTELTEEDAGRIHEAVVAHVGGLPKPEETREMVLDSILAIPGLARRLSKVSGDDYDNYLELIDRIVGVYDKASQIGETDPAKVRAAVTKELAGIRPEVPKDKGPAAKPVPPPEPKQEHLATTEIGRDKDVSPGTQAGIRTILSEARSAYEALVALQRAGVYGDDSLVRELIDLGDHGTRLEVGGSHKGADGRESAGRYDPQTHTAHVYDDAFNGAVSARTFLHEYVHGNTVFQIETGRNRGELLFLHETAREAADKQGKSGQYGLTSPEEFLAEAFTNPEFQNFLRSIKSPGVDKTIWSRFVDWIGRMLGLKSDATLLDDAISVGKRISGKYDRSPVQVPEYARTIEWQTPAIGSKESIQTYNPVTGQIDNAPLLQDSVESVRHNIRDPREFLLPAPGSPIPPPLDPAVRLNREQAINNEVKAVREEVATGTGLVPEAYRKLFGLSNTQAIDGVIANEASVNKATGFKPGQRIGDFKVDENWGPAYVRAARQVNDEMGKVGKVLAQDKELLPKVERLHQGALKAADTHLDNYKDAQFMANEIEKGVRSLTRDDIRKSIRASRDLGAMLQQAADIDGRLDQPVDPRVVTALRKLFTGDELSGSNLFEILDYMANDPGINWGDRASVIRAYISDRAAQDPTLHIYSQLQSDTPEGKVLLSAVIGYGKVHRRTLAELQMRRMQSGEDRVALEQQLKDLWKETREQIDTGVKRVARGAKLEEVARAEYRRTLGQVLKSKKDAEHLTHRIETAEKALPVYRKNLDRLAGKINWTEDSTFGDGMVVRLPKSLDPKPQWEEKTILLNAAAGQVTSPGEILNMAERIALWTSLRELAANQGDETALGLDYWRAKRQLNEIVNNRFYQPALRNTDQFTTGLVLSSAREKLSSIGTPAGSAIATKVGQFQSDNTVFRNQADKAFGYRNPRLESQLIAVINRGRKFRDPLKVDPVWFNKYLLNTILGFAEKGQRPEGMDVEQYRTLRMQQLGEWLMAQDNIAPLISDRLPAFLAGARKLVDSLDESRGYWSEKNRRAELLIEDPKLGEGQLRRAFNVGAWTFARKFSDMYFNMVHALRLAGWAEDKDRNVPGAYRDFQQVAKAYAENPDAARAIVAKYFDHPQRGDTVRNDFLFKLTHTPDESSIHTPAIDESGTTISADPAAVARAYDEAGGDVVGMFERLHDYYNGQNARADYLQDGLLGLARQFMAADAALKKVEPKGAAELKSFVGLIPNAMIDARQFQHWPSEWFDYHKFDRNDNARMAERIAGQIHFGRDTRVLANLHQTLKDETDSLVAKLNDVLTRASRNVPSMRGKLIDAEAEKILASDTSPMLSRFKTGKERLEYLRKVDKRSPFVEGFLRDMTDFYNRGNQADGSLRWGIRLAQELASLLVNQPGSAISQLATMFDIPVQWGASPTMLGRTARTIQLTAKDIAGSFAQAVGWKFLQLGEYEKRFMDLGLQDPESARRFGDIFSTLEGEQQNRAAQFFRVAKDVQSFPVNRLGEQAQYTPLRPLAPFFQTVVSANRALTVSLWELADNYVSKGVRYLKSHPGTEKLTADMLGLKGLEKDGFERWERDIERYGLRYTEMAEKALQRLNTGDKTILTDHDLARLYSLGLNEISLESNIATMPLATFNNSLFRFIVPLLGWSYRRAVQVAGMRLDTKDENSMRAASKAMLGLAATGLGGLGLSLVVDAYQQDVLGKKRNIRNLNVPTSLSDWQGIQERLARVGTLGLWGEAINSAVNVGTGQGDNRMLSVDQRVVALQSFQGLQRAISAFVNQGFDADYKNVVRPVVASIGGNGMLQYMQMANRAFGLDNVESRVVKRINAENWLRVTGRELGFSIRTSGGGYSTPTPITPWIARMEYAAYGNNPEEFRAAWNGAKAEAKAAGKPDPEDYVKKAFETRHPLRYVFAQVPSEREYRQILANLDDTGRESVTEAIRMFNYYGAHIGLTPFQGSVKKDQQRLPGATYDRVLRARLRAVGATP